MLVGRKGPEVVIFFLYFCLFGMFVFCQRLNIKQISQVTQERKNIDVFSFFCHLTYLLCGACAVEFPARFHGVRAELSVDIQSFYACRRRPVVKAGCQGFSSV